MHPPGLHGARGKIMAPRLVRYLEAYLERFGVIPQELNEYHEDTPHE